MTPVAAATMDAGGGVADDATAAAAAGAGFTFASSVVDVAQLWLEWFGEQLISPYVGASTSRGKTSPAHFVSCLKLLVTLVRFAPNADARVLHVAHFAERLAAGNEVILPRLQRDLTTMFLPLRVPSNAVSPVPSNAATPYFDVFRGSPMPPLPLASLDCGQKHGIIYVWSGAPTTLHWCAACSSKRSRPRPPEPTELGLPLCVICVRSSTRAAPVSANAHPLTFSALETADVREQAEIILLHLLLHRPSSKFRGTTTAFARTHGIVVCSPGLVSLDRFGSSGRYNGANETPIDTLRFRTAARQELFLRLACHPNDLSADDLWADWSDSSCLVELDLLRRPSDLLLALAGHWAHAAAAAIGGVPRKGVTAEMLDRALLERCIVAVVEQVRAN